MRPSKLLVIVLAALPVSTALAQNAPPVSPITGKERLEWFAISTAGPQSLAVGVLSAGWGTALGSPEEYGRTWKGFGKRYGMRLTGVSTGNAIDAGLGAIWGEDPRYFRVPDRPFGGRVRHAVVSTFTAYRPDGSMQPAYARIAGNVGNNFLSNTWRVQSESSWQDALSRIAFGFAGRMSSNVFAEFWPELKLRVFRRNKGSSGGTGAPARRD